MPTMPPHRCLSCGQLVTGRCQRCLAVRLGGYRRRFDAHRATASARGYCSERWRTLRQAKLDKDPLCSVCLQRGILIHATDVDHLEPHDGPGDPRFWDWANLDSKCHRCHSRKTATTDSTFARVVR
jgi:5-methylcytosine-specific restriction protein A